MFDLPTIALVLGLFALPFIFMGYVHSCIVLSLFALPFIFMGYVHSCIGHKLRDLAR